MISRIPSIDKWSSRYSFLYENERIVMLLKKNYIYIYRERWNHIVLDKKWNENVIKYSERWRIPRGPNLNNTTSILWRLITNTRIVYREISVVLYIICISIYRERYIKLARERERKKKYIKMKLVKIMNWM